MIYDFFVIDKNSSQAVYHYRNPESKYQLGAGLTSKLAISIVKLSSILSPDQSEKIQTITTTSLKLVFEIIDNFIYLIVSSADHDDLELNYLISELTNGVQIAISQGNLTLFDINKYLYKGRARLSNKSFVTKTILMRLGGIIKQLSQLSIEIDVISELRSLPASDVVMISTLEMQMEQELQKITKKIKSLPSLGAGF
ncbi:MAG: hypothetical protein J7L47_03575 [Candidatus Odinarchaeota archaeon]|nr:hypothetical protein [Candidatus Odinarchaeota archaeon]